MPPDPHPRDRFATTRWSVVLRARDGRPEQARQALGELIEAYWYPLYAYSRRQGSSNDDAMDLTQGFFTHLLAGDAFESVSPEKGRLRSFLLTSFKNYMANQRRAAASLRRGGAATTLSMTASDFQARYDREPADHKTPEVLFLRSWVRELLARVRARLAQEYQRAGKADLFTLLEPYLTPGGEPVPRVEIGRRLKLSSAAVAMSIHRMRRSYGDLLRQEVAATVDDPSEIEDELRTLMGIISQPD